MSGLRAVASMNALIGLTALRFSRCEGPAEESKFVCLVAKP